MTDSTDSMVMQCYTIRYNYSDGRMERQGSYAATKSGKEMADINASLHNTLTQMGETTITATVEEVWFSPDKGYDYREAQS
jgi:uncharacterized protein YqjF (DUF2071 family)